MKGLNLDFSKLSGKAKLLSAIITSAIIIVLVLNENPQLFSSNTLKDNSFDLQIPAPSLLIKEDGFSSSKFVNYRSNEFRTGEDKIRNVWDYRLQWKMDGLNIGVHTASKSSPAVDESGIYVGSDDGWFYAYQLQGQLKWKFSIEGATRGIHATASLDQKYVYFGGYNGQLYCLEKETGKPKWIIDLGDTIGASTLLTKEGLYASVETFSPPNGFLYKLNSNTGAVIWKTRFFGEQGHSSPVLSSDRMRVMVGANNSQYFSFDVSTGKNIWTTKLKGMIKGTGLQYNGQVFVADRGGMLSVLDELNGKIVSEIVIGLRGSQSSPALAVRSEAILISGILGDLIAISSKTHQVLWKRKVDLPEGELFLSSPVSDKANFWVLCERQKICQLEGRTGKLISAFEFKGRLTSVPAFFEDIVALSTNAPGALSVYKAQR